MKFRQLPKKLIETIKTQSFIRDDFMPLFINEKWHKPKYSLREQADLRKGCIMLGLNPASLNLPEIKAKPFAKSRPEGTKYQKNYLERKAKVDKALDNMPKIISKWKEELKSENAKSLTNLPF